MNTVLWAAGNNKT